MHAQSVELSHTTFVCESDLSNIVCSSRVSPIGKMHDVAAYEMCPGKLLTSNLQLSSECQPAYVLVMKHERQVLYQ